MIGKVIEGRYEGASVNKLPDKNVLFIQTEDGTKIALSKSNAISIDDVTDQYPSYGRKVMMVMWNDFETSIIQIGHNTVSSNSSKNNNHSSSSKQKHSTKKSTKQRKSKMPWMLGSIALIIIFLFAALIILLPQNGNDEQIATTLPDVLTDIQPDETEPVESASNNQASLTHPSETSDITNENATTDLFAVARGLKKETLQYPSQNDEWKYDVYESHVSISQYIGNSSVATIPSTIEGLPVKGIGHTLREGNTFDEIIIPDTVVYVGSYAFCRMPIKRVTFVGDNRIVFAEAVFKNCTSLENMDDIVAHIYGDTIPAEMFSAKYVYSSSYITYDDYNLDDVLYLPPNIKRIGEEAFCGLSKLKKINLENIEQVDEEAFHNAGITEADFSSLTILGEEAFRGCGIKEVVLHKVVDIPEGAFAWCGAELIDLGIAQTVGEDALPRMLPALYIRNPSCEIKSSAFGYLVNDKMIVYGLPGSTAAKFASANNCTFNNINNSSISAANEPTVAEKPNTSIYHWNEPKCLSFPLADVQVNTYKVENIEGATPAYAIEITCDSMTSKELMTFMIHSTDDWGFDRISLAERIQKVLDMYDDAWTHDTMMYCSMSGYGIEWTVSLGTDEHFCGIIGLTTNKPNEFEAVLGMMPQD